MFIKTNCLSNFKEREKRHKHENDSLIANVHNTLSKDAKTEAEKQALLKLLLTKQQEANERLIQDQSNQIEQLKIRCQKYENDFKRSHSIDGK